MSKPEQIPERIWKRISISESGCWVCRSVTRAAYPFITYEKKAYPAHRLIYTLLRGKIPDKMALDHLCRNKPCCNPDHLEVVTVAENTRRAHLGKRKLTCVNGHDTSDPSSRYRDGKGNCKKCARMQNVNGPKGLRLFPVDPRIGSLAPSLPKHVASKIQIAESGCWEWTGRLTSKGYSTVSIGDKKSASAYRVIYIFAKGEVAAGLHLDHLCRNRKCVNPDHLEPVTPSENSRRSSKTKKTFLQCRNGHPFVGNRGQGYYGKTFCRICRNIQQAKKPRGVFEAKHGHPPKHRMTKRTASLNAEQVTDIRYSGISAKDAAAKYGLKLGTIYNIRYRDCYKNYP